MEERRPSWASEITRRTPASPRARRERKKAVQNALSSLSAHGQAQDLTVAVGRHAGGHDDGLGHHPGAVVGLDVGGIDEDVGELDVVQPPLPELADSTVELGADAADLALGDPSVDAQGPDQIVDLASRDPVDEGFHDHRPQRPVDAATGLEQRGEEAAVAQLGDLQVHVAGFGGQQPGSAAVAVGGAVGVALVWGGADLLGRLQVDEGWRCARMGRRRSSRSPPGR